MEFFLFPLYLRTWCKNSLYWTDSIDIECCLRAIVNVFMQQQLLQCSSYSDKDREAHSRLMHLSTRSMDGRMDCCIDWCGQTHKKVYGIHALSNFCSCNRDAGRLVGRPVGRVIGRVWTQLTQCMDACACVRMLILALADWVNKQLNEKGRARKDVR